jgi:wyosine [tRNA(Phe)-imidazoG37] synthetase (radical SAM superfamily)
MPTFGPVPSRRLGRSLGINTIQPKTCTYSCVYCQLGRTTRMLAEPRELSEPTAVLREVEEKLAATRQCGERVDILTFVPDGARP